MPPRLLESTGSAFWCRRAGREWQAASATPLQPTIIEFRLNRRGVRAPKTENEESSNAQSGFYRLYRLLSSRLVEIG